MSQKIKSIQKGCGENYIFFSTDPKIFKQFFVEEIKEESKQVSPDIIFNIYRGYSEDKLVFEMGASIDVIMKTSN